MGKLRYIVRKTDQISRDLINSDLRKLGMVAKNLAVHAFMLGLGFGTYFLKVLALLLILDRTGWKTNMLTVFLVSYTCLSLPAVVFSFSRVPSTGVKGNIILVAGCIQLFGFCTFKARVGTFWPSIMKMRSQNSP